MPPKRDATNPRCICGAVLGGGTLGTAVFQARKEMMDSPRLAMILAKDSESGN